MTKLIRFTQISAVAVALFYTTAHSAFALGFKNPDQDARATGQGEAFVAQADDAAAIYYNPAGLTQLKGTVVTSGGYITFRDIQFNGATANETLNDPAFTGFGYVETDFGLEKWRFGFGFNVPYGNDVDWGNNSTFKYRVTKSNLAVRNYQPTVAYKLNEHLSLGAGLNYYAGQTELNRDVPFSILFFPLPVPDGRFRFDGDGQALGGTAGLMWKINDKNSVGVVYRSPFSIDFHGHAIVKDDPLGVFGRSSATAEITFPQTVAVGYAFRPTAKLKLEVDWEWTNWDTLNSVRLHSPNPAFATDPGSVIPFNWEDSSFYELGVQYELNKTWVLRAGYIFSENTVPNSTFAPTLPDSNRHVFSIGVGHETKRYTLDLVYQYSFADDRTVSNSADTNFDGAGDVDGKWKSQGQAIMVTSRLRF